MSIIAHLLYGPYDTSSRSGLLLHRAEVGALASAGGDRLVVAGYVDQGGSGIVRAALDSGAFDTFHFPDGMISAALEENFGDEIDGSTGQHPGTDSPGAARFAEMVGDAFDATSPFAPESYDAAALIMLAMQAAGSAEPGDYKDKVMMVANAPGEQIFPGELAKAMEILSNGGDASSMLNFVLGVFLANFPEAMSSSGVMKRCGLRSRTIVLMWTAIVAWTALGAAIGALLFPPGSEGKEVLRASIEGVCGGAMLTMIAETVLPEAVEQGGSVVGLSCLFGFLAALSLAASFPGCYDC